jgi:hypothetical protein
MQTRNTLTPKLQAIRFGEFLYEQSLITDEQLLDALGTHWQTGNRIGQAIAECGYVAPEEIERQAALYHGLDVVEI